MGKGGRNVDGRKKAEEEKVTEKTLKCYAKKKSTQFQADGNGI